ncbi:hypothetical protein EW145_g571 [Phellinidium pouzarii]|uniref:Zn(2)-C6 fungal-type domain-containing protein n=1 Tax=Phellinidium pouzarii TaxID=167371 RepID=A0A4S4LIC8_9AGAM|nr:hypothetical protein EW145_g571 [Phellinidium pouzarii]
MAAMNDSEPVADRLKAPVGAAAQAKARKTRERELERKRERGDVSCAECRRLKLKCNKKIPCGSCVRRGCHIICPNGSLASGKGSRFVLANTDKLHSKLLEMSKRIRQLEDALQIAQATISSEPHPLLSEDLLPIKTGVDVHDEKESMKLEENEEEEPEISAAFGTLSMTERGETRFMGRAGSEALLMNAYNQIEEQSTSIEDSDVFRALPAEINHAAEAFPFVLHVNLSKDQVLALIEARLPSYERATALVEAYLENVSWFFLPVQREQIMEVILPSIYKRQRSGKPDLESGNDSNADVAPNIHGLALALALFACGATADLTLVPQNAEAGLYHHLARAALSLQSVFEGASLKTVQAVMLLAAYDFLAGKKKYTRICLENVIVWTRACIKCHAWQYRFIKEIIAPISEYFCLTRQSKYSEILEFDRKIRDFEEHPLLREELNEHGKPVGRRRYSSSMAPEVEHPANPMRSSFAPSFLAAFAASTSLLRGMRAASVDNVQMLLRQWPVWAHTLTAGVIMGSVASRSRTSTLALIAFKELDIAVDLFEKAISHPVVKGGLPILRRLRNKALDSLQRAAGIPSPLSALRNVDDNEENELTILQGTARFVQVPSKSKSEHTSSNLPASSRSDDSKSSTSSPRPTYPTAADIHSSSSTKITTPLRQQYSSHGATTPSIASVPQSEKVMQTERVLEDMVASSVDDAAVRLPIQQQNVEVALPDTELDLIALMDFVNSNSLGADPSGSFPLQSDPSHQLHQPTMQNSVPSASYYSLEPQNQGMNVDEWSELGFRTVMESLISEPTQAPAAMYTSDLDVASNAFELSGRLPLDSNTQPQHFGIDYSDASQPMPNERLSAFGGYSPEVYGGHPEQGSMQTNAGVDDDASLVDAWRSIAGNPQFMGERMGTDMFL